MTKKQTTTGHKANAEARAELLWQFYHANGGKLYLADIKKLTGQIRPVVYMSFANNGVKGPPVWDTQEAKRQRQLKALNDMAAALGRDWLTSAEAASALGVKTGMIYSKNRNFIKMGLDFPVIVFSKTRVCSEKPKGVNAAVPRQNVSDSLYRDGLPVLRERPGAHPGQVIYTLR